MIQNELDTFQKSHFLQVETYNKLIKKITECYSLGGYGESGITINVVIMKRQSFFRQIVKNHFTHIKSMESCWRYCIVPWYHRR